MPLTNLNTNSTQVKQPSTQNGAASSITVTTTSTSLADSTSSAYGALMSFYNAGTGTVFIDFGSTVSTSAYASPLPSGFIYETPEPHQGKVSGIVAAGSSNVLVRKSDIVLI